MVITCPTTANQRSWISCCMFLWPVALSRLATPARGACSSPATAETSVGAAVVLALSSVGMRGIVAAAVGWVGELAAAAIVAPHEPGRARDHQRQAVPGDGVDKMAVGKGDDREPPSGPCRCCTRGGGHGLGIDEVGRRIAQA